MRFIVASLPQTVRKLMMIDPNKKAKLKWNCRRGMLELDLILSRFVENGLEQLNDEQVGALENLLNYTDPEIYAWLMGQEEPIDKEIENIVAVIRAHDHIQ